MANAPTRARIEHVDSEPMSVLRPITSEMKLRSNIA